MKKRHLSMVSGVLVGAVLGWLVLRHFEWRQAYEMVSNASLFYLLCMAVLTVAAFFLRALRLQVLLAGGCRRSIWRTFSVISVAELCELAVPLRVGVPVRAFLMLRLLEVPFSRGLAASIVERLIDLLVLVGMVLTTVFLLLPAHDALEIPAGMVGNADAIVVPLLSLRVGAIGLAGIAVLCTAALVATWWARNGIGGTVERVVALFSTKWAQRLSAPVTRFAGHLQFLRDGRHAMALMLITASSWSCVFLSFLFTFAAFGFTVPIYTPIVTLSILVLGSTALPNAPALVGQYHMSIVLSLLIVSPEISLTESTGVAVAMHVVHMMSVFAMGMVSIVGNGISLRMLWTGGEEAGETPPDAP